MALSIALRPTLRCNVALDNLSRDVASRGRKIASRPQGRQPFEDSVLLAQMMRRESFALLDHLCGRVGRPDAHEEMDMIGLNRQLHNGPPTLGTFLLDEQPTVLSNGATKDSFAPLGAPDEVVDDKVD